MSHGLFRRHPGNPILTAADWPTPVNAVFKPGAAVVDGETVVVARVEDRSGISHLGVAGSADGVGGSSVAPEPLLAPTDGIESEQWGFEDHARFGSPSSKRWMITCTAYGPSGPAVYLAMTTDFRSVERIGIICQPEDKNAALLPDRVDGKWILFHRPMTAYAGSRGEIVLSRSDDLMSRSAPEQVLQPRHGAWWDSLRIGLGPPPLRTEHGWLVGSTESRRPWRTPLPCRPRVTALEDPARVLHRAPEWVLGPSAPYERVGDIPNTVFPCGLVHDAPTGEVRLYYGAADTSICLATAQLDELLDAVLA